MARTVYLDGVGELFPGLRDAAAKAKCPSGYRLGAGCRAGLATVAIVLTGMCGILDGRGVVAVGDGGFCGMFPQPSGGM